MYFKIVGCSWQCFIYSFVGVYFYGVFIYSGGFYKLSEYFCWSKCCVYEFEVVDVEVGSINIKLDFLGIVIKDDIGDNNCFLVLLFIGWRYEVGWCNGSVIGSKVQFVIGVIGSDFQVDVIYVVFYYI